MKVEWIANPNSIGDKPVGLVEDLQESLARVYVQHGYCRLLEDEPERRAVDEAIEDRMVHEATEHKVLRGKVLRGKGTP